MTPLSRDAQCESFSAAGSKISDGGPAGAVTGRCVAGPGLGQLGRPHCPCGSQTRRTRMVNCTSPRRAAPPLTTGPRRGPAGAACRTQTVMAGPRAGPHPGSDGGPPDSSRRAARRALDRRAGWEHGRSDLKEGACQCSESVAWAAGGLPPTGGAAARMVVDRLTAGQTMLIVALSAPAEASALPLVSDGQ